MAVEAEAQTPAEEEALDVAVPPRPLRVVAAAGEEEEEEEGKEDLA